LTKSQAFLAYKLGLLLGFSTRWQDYVTEFGGVIGGGFIWRQIARSLIGLVPGWGIIPKVAVAYSGTYVVGNAILGWYESGRNLSPNQMRDLSKQAFNRGKEFAKMLGEKFPRGKTGKQHKKQAQALASLNLLPNTSNSSDYNISLSPQRINVNSDEIVIEKKPGHPSEVLHPAQVKNINSKTRILSPAKKLWRKPIITRRDTPRENKDRMQDPIVSDHICSNCGKKSSGDAVFCQYCGLPL